MLGFFISKSPAINPTTNHHSTFPSFGGLPVGRGGFSILNANTSKIAKGGVVFLFQTKPLNRTPKS